MLRELLPEELSGRSAEIVEGLAEWLTGRPELKRIAVFSSLSDEPRLSALHDYRPEREFVYPRIQDDHRLSFHAVTAPDSLVTGPLGILEPNPQHHPAHYQPAPRTGAWGKKRKIQIGNPFVR